MGKCSAHADSPKVRETLNILKLLSYTQGIEHLPLCHKFTYEHQTAVEGQGYFDQCLLLRGFLPVI